MAKGDSFSNVSKSYLNVNPNEETWTARIEYLLKIIAGSGIAPMDKATLSTFSSSDGTPSDNPADSATLITNPKQPYTQIQLLKAILLFIDNVETRIDIINDSITNGLAATNANITTTNTKLNALNLKLNELTLNTDTLEATTQAILTKLQETPQPKVYTTFFNSGINTDVIITLPAVTGKKRFAETIIVSYAGGTGKGLLTIKEGITTYLQTAIALEGTQVIAVPSIQSSAGGTLEIKLSAGGAGITSYLNIVGGEAIINSGGGIPSTGGVIPVIPVIPATSRYSSTLATLLGTSGATNLVNGQADDANINIGDMGFDFRLNGATYRSNIFVGSNSYLTFGFGSIEYGSLSQTNPGRALLVAAADRSWNKVDVKQDAADKYRVIWQGGSSSGGGTPYTWELSLFADGAMQLVMGAGTPSAGLSMLTKGDGVTSLSYTTNAASAVNSLVFLPTNAAGDSHTVQVGSYS